MNSKVTIVTGLWDLGRANLDGWAKRSFDTYKQKFFELLETDANLCIWIPRSLESEVWKIRKRHNTVVYFKELDDFKTWFPFFNELQKIRTNPAWYNFAGWLKESPQAALEFYNPMMMCKMFMVNDTAILNPFRSEYFYWIDGGITSTVNPGYFTTDKVFDRLPEYTQFVDKFTFISYPYTANDEIHGFERKKMAQYCNTSFVEYVCRGGFFGGSKEQVHSINNYYYNFLYRTLNEGLMGADECLFTILAHNYPNEIHRYEITGNGLVWPFFENLKTFDPKTQVKTDLNIKKCSLYVLTFNSPNQFKTLIKSMEVYDEDFLKLPKKYLINNSTNSETYMEYDNLCKEYGFTHYKPHTNLGICGGRQYIAEHFDESDSDFMMFFEDDMFFYSGPDVHCKNGFVRKVDKLYIKSLSLVKEHNFDFLKLNFTEFFGDNSTQWSWYNVPQNVRQKYFPENNKLPQQGLDPNAPKTKYDKIMSYKGVPYATGEVYYCNWPQVMTKEGSRKVFLNTKWAHPHEQTWMSHVYQMTKENLINAGILLATPTEHNRFDHYDKELRKES
jgi:hypothetical protein